MRGEPIDRRADVFAMGIVLYALTTGKHPFRKESEGATLFAITAAEPVIAPRKFVPDYPQPLQDVLLKALEKDRDQRYASASELLKALDRALPPAARGSDEEVGAFVRGLFEEQRKQSQAVLADALGARRQAPAVRPRADPSSPRPRRRGQSGVSALSTVGVAASLAPPKPSVGDIDAAFAGRDGKRFIKLAVVGGLAVVGRIGRNLVHEQRQAGRAGRGGQTGGVGRAARRGAGGACRDRARGRLECVAGGAPARPGSSATAEQRPWHRLRADPRRRSQGCSRPRGAGQVRGAAGNDRQTVEARPGF